MQTTEAEKKVPVISRSTGSGFLHGERKFGLDLFRALAISLVLASHWLKPLEPLGWIGVELFFVLSGFLIGGILLRGTQQENGVSFDGLALFWKRRWFRTLPNYYLFLGINVGLLLSSSEAIPAKFPAYLLFLQNFAWPLRGFFQVSWSLCVEEWFYLLYPIALFLCFKATRNLPRAFACATVLFLIFPLVYRSSYAGAYDWNTGMRMVTFARLDSLMFGVVLALIQSYNSALWKQLVARSFAGSFLLTILLASLFRNSGNPIVPAPVFLTLLPFSVALVLPGFDSLRRPACIMATPIENLSKWSYSIYLAHIPVLFVAYRISSCEQAATPLKLTVKVSALLATIVLSALLYRYFERPIMGLRPAERRNFRPAPQRC